MGVLHSFTAWFLPVMLDQLRILRAMLELDPLRPRYLSLARDLTADDKRAQKIVDCVLRYGELALEDRAVVLCVDEKSQIQALDRIQPGWHSRRAARRQRPMAISAKARPRCSPRWMLNQARSSAIACPANAPRSS
jgi:hypothetical protein